MREGFGGGEEGWWWGSWYALGGNGGSDGLADLSEVHGGAGSKELLGGRANEGTAVLVRGLDTFGDLLDVEKRG